MGIEFGNPIAWYFGFAVVAAWLLVFYGGLLGRRRLKRFADLPLVKRLLENYSKRRYRLKRALVLVALLLVVVALGMPRMGRGMRIVKREGADVAIALDVSLSMLTEDIKPNRMEVAKQAIRTLISMLPDDRFALVGFAGDSFIHCPLTVDRGALAMFLDYLEPGAVPEQGTDIGRAIETSIKALRSSRGRGKAIVLITDGEDHGTRLESAIEEARSQGIRIYAVGVGTEAGEPIPIRDKAGNVISYKRDAKDNVVVSKLNLALLKRIATETGGETFLIGSAGKVGKLARDLAKLERGLIEERSYQDYQEIFQVPLLIGIVLLALEATVADGRRHG